MQLQQAEWGSTGQQPKIQDTYAEKMNKALNSKTLLKEPLGRLVYVYLSPYPRQREGLTVIYD